jgi:hypothetical protein
VSRGGKVRERYVYDDADNLIEKQDASGATLLSIDVGPGNLVAERKLPSGDRHRLERDRRGRLTKAECNAGKLSFAYDAWGRRIQDAPGTSDATTRGLNALNTQARATCSHATTASKASRDTRTTQPTASPLPCIPMARWRRTSSTWRATCSKRLASSQDPWLSAPRIVAHRVELQVESIRDGFP